MSVGPKLMYNEFGYSQIIHAHDGVTRYRTIKNPSIWTQIYYLTFVDSSNEIHVTLYPWDCKIAGLDP